MFVTQSIVRKTNWNRHFTFQGKELFYNRIDFNNRAERAVEVPIAFDFLAQRAGSGNVLEVGNVLQHYENGLSDLLRIRERRIVDKFEAGEGIDRVDIMDVDVSEKYQTIISVSTLEHVGQSCAPSGEFGEQKRTTDREAPLKAIAKIYDLLAVGGEALLTIPFGKLIDGGWYIQFSLDYLNLITSKYGIPQEAISIRYLKNVAREPVWKNPYQKWLEVEPQELSSVRYDTIAGGARAIAVITLTKLEQPFTLNLAHPQTPLGYESSQIMKSVFFAAGLLKKGF
jgi:hypothetical protein